MRERLFCEQLEGGVVVDLSVFEHAAMPMIRVLAHADVGDHHESRRLALERTHCLLHWSAIIPGRRPGRVLHVRYAEEQHTADA